MESQVLHTAWCYISGEAAGEIWNWSLLGVKGLKVNEEGLTLERALSNRHFEQQNEYEYHTVSCSYQSTQLVHRCFHWHANAASLATIAGSGLFESYQYSVDTSVLVLSIRSRKRWCSHAAQFCFDTFTSYRPDKQLYDPTDFWIFVKTSTVEPRYFEVPRDVNITEFEIAGFRNNWVTTKWLSKEGESAWLRNSGYSELTEFEIARCDCKKEIEKKKNCSRVWFQTVKNWSKALKKTWRRIWRDGW